MEYFNTWWFCKEKNVSFIVWKILGLLNLVMDSIVIKLIRVDTAWKTNSLLHQLEQVLFFFLFFLIKYDDYKCNLITHLTSFAIVVPVVVLVFIVEL